MRRKTATYKAAAGLIFSFALLVAAEAGAQTLFKCGKTYQDRPCDAGQETKVLNTSRAADQSPGVSDASCAQRGVAAQKIVWAREGGAILDQQLANARSSDERKLVSDVYNRRGTSSEIRAAIETDCVAEKEKAARMAALVGVSGSAPVAATAETARHDAEHGHGMERGRNRAQTGGGTEYKKSCDALRMDLDSVRNAQRAGGSAAAMEELRKDKADAERQLAQYKC